MEIELLENTKNQLTLADLEEDQFCITVDGHVVFKTDESTVDGWIFYNFSRMSGMILTHEDQLRYKIKRKATFKLVEV